MTAFAVPLDIPRSKAHGIIINRKTINVTFAAKNAVSRRDYAVATERAVAALLYSRSDACNEQWRRNLQVSGFFPYSKRWFNDYQRCKVCGTAIPTHTEAFSFCHSYFCALPCIFKSIARNQ